jgi:hypothetical protein
MPQKRSDETEAQPPPSKSRRVTIKIPSEWPVRDAEKRTGLTVNDLAREGVRRACFPEAT